ncbi:MAG: hypothetical protein PWQ20_514, partial [Thermotogaceae bacterium]|nr:hypothetical protein [Thermotogaceae bacterium]
NKKNLCLTNLKKCSKLFQLINFLGGFIMHEHDHEHEHVDVFALRDEDGKEHFFVLLAEIEDSGNNYWVCKNVEFDESSNEITSEGDIYLFRSYEDEDGSQMLDSVSEEELQRVSKIWEQMSNEVFLDEELDEEELEEDYEDEEQ